MTSSNFTDEKVDKRVKQLLDMEPEDPQTITDLADADLPERKTKFDLFWSECSKFLAEDVGETVDDRRHDTVTHLAKAISIRDLLEQVKSRCPSDTLVPSQEWLRLQFWPRGGWNRSRALPDAILTTLKMNAVWRVSFCKNLFLELSLAAAMHFA